MADALLSPAVGVTFWTASGAALAYCASKIRKTLDDHKVPLMGVLGAFIFAAQLINFTIPGTGSSGHLGGGLLLSLLLGPYAAFLTISSVLVIQAFFFADGGLLALGTNIFNLGVFPCFLGLPVFRLLAGKNPSSGRLAGSSIVAAAAGLEMGAMGVVLETLLSGRSELAAGPFVALMGGIHLPIGVIEGFVTAAVLGYVLKIRPELAAQAFGTTSEPGGPPRSLAPVLASFAVAALLAGGLLAWFASSRPDGLEWSIERAARKDHVARPEQGLASSLAKVQQKTAFLPEYTLPAKEAGKVEPSGAPAWPAVDRGNSIAGFVGALLTLACAGTLGFIFTRRRSRTNAHKQDDET
ncbi:MAG: energy-coupling factor ABC transporter permease [Candidatus Methylomirabilia bacterium]